MSYFPTQICLKFSTALVLLLFFHTTYGQYNFSAVDEIIGNKREQAAGNASVIIWKDGNIIYKKDTGSLKAGKVEVVQPIGAASRWLTAALVMQFVDEGKLSLDDEISKYLPVFSSYSKGYITIRQCLANTTGIEGDLRGKVRIIQKKFSSLEEEVNYYAAHNDIVNNPGKDFFYGDAGIKIAARILEIITKRKTFDRLIQEKIIRPLGMKKTTFMVESGAVDPANGAKSTAGDYIRFLGMLLNKGELGGKRILSEDAIAEMNKMQITTAAVKYMPKMIEGASYGLGVFIEEDNKVVSCPSFTSNTWPFIDLCRKYACIIFTPPLSGKAVLNREMYRKVKEAIDQEIICK